MMQRLLFVGIPESHARRSIARAQRVGFTVIVADSDRRLREHGALIAGADRHVVVDYESYEELAALATRLDDEAGLDAIFTFKERALLPTARLVADRGLVGNGPRCVEACLNKLSTRDSLARAGLPGPAYQLCRSEVEFAAFAERLGTIVVAKPVDGQGSAGVTASCPGGDDAGRAYRLAAAHGTREILAEEFVEGREVSVEAGVFNGTPVVFGITEKHLFRGTFVEGGHTTPDGGGLTRRSCQDVLERVVDALDIEFGPIHLELFLTAAGPVVGEVHTRYGGDCIVPLTERAARRDMTTPIFAELAGLPTTVRGGRAVAHVGIRYLTVPPGRVARVSGVATARAVDGVLEVHVDCAPGDVVEPLRSSDDRRGYVIATAPSRAKLEATLAAALDKVRISVESASAPARAPTSVSRPAVRVAGTHS